MKKDIYSKLFRKIKKNSKLAIFGTNQTAINIFNKLKELRKDVSIIFFISTKEEGILQNLPIYSFYNIEDKIELIDGIIIASYSQGYLFSAIFKSLGVKQTIAITSDFVEKKPTPKPEKLFAFEKTKLGFEITILKHVFKIENNKNKKDFLIEQLFKQEKALAKQRNNLNFILSHCDITHLKKAQGFFREFQETRLLALKYFTKKLKENNIEYWIDFGTLIGAIRHKGFIPWDEDIDLAMTRENYKKTIQLFSEELKNTNFETHIGKYEYSSLLRFCDKETKIPLVDVFPYDFCNNNELNKKQIEYQILLSTEEMLLKYPIEEIKSDVFASTERIEEIFNIYKNHNLQKNNMDKPRWLFRGIDSMSKCRKPSYHEFKDIYPLQKMQFEDMELFAPNNPQEYLKNSDAGAYGDIMNFPDYDKTNIPKIYSKQEDEELREKLGKIRKELEKLF